MANPTDSGWQDLTPQGQDPAAASQPSVQPNQATPATPAAPTQGGDNGWTDLTQPQATSTSVTQNTAPNPSQHGAGGTWSEEKAGPKEHPAAPHGLLRRAWDYANTPIADFVLPHGVKTADIVRGAAFEKMFNEAYIPGINDFETKAELHLGDSPTKAALKAFIAGSVHDTADVAAGFTSPLAVATLGGGEELSAGANATGKLATAVKVANTARKVVKPLAGSAFTLQGAGQAIEGASSAVHEGLNAENASQMAGGVGQAILGGTHLGSEIKARVGEVGKHLVTKATPQIEESPMGAQIPTRNASAVGRAVAAGAPEQAADFAQKQTAPAVQKAVGGTIGEAVGSNAETAITPEDRMGLKGHAHDLIENQARPVFKKIDELSGGELTKAQNKISSGWSQRDMEKVGEGESEKAALYDKYREPVKAKYGMNVDDAERNYARGKSAERMAKRLDVATGPTNVEGAPYEVDGQKLMKVVDDGEKNGSWKRMGLTDDHINELKSLAKTMASQSEKPKVSLMLKGLGKLAIGAAGLHGGIVPALEAVSGVSAADYLGGKVSQHILQEGMTDFKATQAMNDAIKTGNAQPVIDELSKNPSWVKRTTDYVTDLGKRLWKDEKGELRIGKDSPAEKMHEETLKNGGATYDDTGNLSDKDAWSVGAYPERSQTLSPEEFTPEAIRSFSEKNRDLLNQKDHAVGSWKDPDTNKTFLDVTRLIKDKDEAIQVGKKANQKAIWHLKNQELVDTGGTGEAPTTTEPTRNYQYNPTGTNNEHSVTTQDASGKKIGELAAQETGNVANRQVTVRSNQVYDAADRGKGHGKGQIMSLLNGVSDDVKSVKSDISTTGDAKRVWESLERQYPEAITKKVVGKGDSAKTVWTVDMDKFRGTKPTPPSTAPVDPQAAYRQSLNAKEIGTRNPKSADATGVNDPSQLSGIEALNEADEMSPARMTQAGKPVLGVKQKLVAALADYKDNGISHLLDASDPEAAIEKYVNHLSENLKWLHGATPEAIRSVAKQWYETAHNVTKDIAQANGVSHEQAAAVTAALSPKNDWNNNVGQAQRLIEHYAKDRGHAWTSKMDTAMSAIRNSEAVSEPLRKVLDDIRGKKFKQLTAKSPEALRAKQAMWMRVLDEAHGANDTPIYNPNGQVTGSQTLNWGQIEPIAKALSILENGSVDNINRVMGQGHKIRNFYNNIINPWSERGHTTIDTHAVGAGHLKPYSQEDTEVAHNFGSGNKAGMPSPAKHAATGIGGSYSVHEEAYRRAAKDLGIQPRELQSITWEGIRSLMGDEKKTPELRRAVTNIWRAHEAGELTLNQAREEIVKASGGFSKPSWMSDEDWERNPTEEGDTSFGGQ